MQKSLALLTLLALFSSLSRAQSDRVIVDTSQAVRQSLPSVKAMAAATGFIKGLIKGTHADTLINFCTTPFTNDGESTITNIDSLKKELADQRNSFLDSSRIKHPRLDSAYVYGVRRGVMYGDTATDIYYVFIIITATVPDTETDDHPEKEVNIPLVIGTVVSDRARIVSVTR